MKLAILIPTTPDRKPLLDRLIQKILSQMNTLALTGGVNEPDSPQWETDVCVFINEDNYERSVGKKRNELIQMAVAASANTIAFVDSDDLIGDTYLERAMQFVASDCDTAELWGQIYWSGKPGKPFHHSIKYKEWYEDDKFYYRCNNHLNFFKLSVVKDFKFPDYNFGEDGIWSMAIKDAGVLKKEFPISEVIYHYFCGDPKHEIK